MVCWGCAAEYAKAAGALVIAAAGSETIVITVAAGAVAVGEIASFISCVQEKCPEWDIQWAIDAMNAIKSAIGQ